MANGSCDDRVFEPSSGARAVDEAASAPRLEVSLLLRRRSPDVDQDPAAGQADIDAVTQFADWYGLSVVRHHPARRIVVLAGTIAQFEDAFSIDRGRHEPPGGWSVAPVESIHLPDELRGRIEAVLGLDQKPKTA